jgi:hypothetical protein
VKKEAKDNKLVGEKRVKKVDPKVEQKLKAKASS